MQCKICGSNLVRGFTFCLECGTPVPPEMLEESGLPDRNTDRGPEEITPPNVSRTADNSRSEEQIGDLRPKLVGGEQDRGEALKPKLIGGDTYEQGKALKPKLMGLGEEDAGEALKPRLIGGEEQTGSGQKVRASFQNSSSDVSGTAVEKLVFCPNCGMHMQHNPDKCEMCGMALGNIPNNVPTTSSGIPLFNTDPDPFSGTGGLGNFTGGFGSISDEDVSRIDNFVKGNTDPMFNSGSSAFNVQATPADFAQLTNQIANFSAAAVPDIGVTENTRIRQKAAPKGQDVELSDFSMTDDLQSESIPISDKHVPIVGDYAMEENPDEDINIDPFAFVSMSMDEEPQLPKDEPRMETAQLTEAAPAEPAPVPAAENIGPEPVRPPSFSESAPAENTLRETAPFIVEEPSDELPVIGESTPNPAGTEKSVPKNPPNTDQVHPVSEPVPAPPSQQVQQPQRYKQAQPYQQPHQVQQPQPYQQAQPYQQPQQVQQPQAYQQAQPYQQPQQVQQPQAYQQAQQPDEAAPKPAEKTKKCFACGRTMPVNDKFCPNCGRSMFGVPNPNLIHQQPMPSPAKKVPVAVIFIVIVLIVAAAVVFLTPKGKAAEIGFGEPEHTVSNAGQTFSETAAEHIVS